MDKLFEGDDDDDAIYSSGVNDDEEGELEAEDTEEVLEDNTSDNEPNSDDICANGRPT